MFLDSLLKSNPRFVDAAIKLKDEGLVEPDSYLIDLETFLSNAKMILEEAKKYNKRVYYMLKQLGRNPYLAKKLEELGYDGAVCVDFKEALTLKRNGCHLGNIGHLVQIPKQHLEELISYGVDVITVYSVTKIKEISEVASKLNKTQDIMLKVYDDSCTFYDGQQSGFRIEDLEELYLSIKDLPNIRVSGVTSFPAMLYNLEKKKFELTNNYKAIIKARDILESLGAKIIHVNTPSGNCTESIKYLTESNEIEPGHGLTGTTPYHSLNTDYEKICYLYVSETSHEFKNETFFYGGGHYRRGHFTKALVVDGNKRIISDVVVPTDDNIDYHFKLEGNYGISKTVIGCFRTQIFTTRSNVYIIDGVSKNDPKIVGIYTSLGGRIE